jgi:triosephosphate isomerase
MALVIANWKMNGSQQLCAEFKDKLLSLITANVEVVICPPAIYLSEFKNSKIVLGAQNVHQEEFGAFTGEISAAMLAEMHVKYVLVGHSERRQWFAESDQDVCAKVLRLQQHGLIPVVCVGETLEQFKAEQSFSVVEKQLNALINSVDLHKLVIAYEPIWAIGTGMTATPEVAQNMHSFIRSKLANNATKIIYGGSVKADNALALFAQPEIAGALVGGASLNVESFAKICNSL